MAAATLVYDDDCGFCTWWANFVEKRSDLRLVGFSEVKERAEEDDELDDLRSRLPDGYQSCSHLVIEDDVYSCGASIEEALVRSELCDGVDLRDAVEFFRTFEDYNRLREGGYRWVADHRGLLGHVFSADPPARRSDDPASESDDEN